LLTCLLASVAQARPFAYVANSASQTLSIVDLANGGATRTVNLPSLPTSVAVTPDGRFVYVVSEGTTRGITVINAETAAIVNTISGFSSPKDLAFSPDGSRAYVTNGETNGAVAVVNTATRLVEGNIPVGRNPREIVISPDGNYIYVVNTGATVDTVSVIRAADNSVVNTITVGRGATEAVVSRDGKRLYVVNTDDNMVFVIDTSNGVGNGAIGTFTVFADPTSIAINPAGTRLYVLRRGASQGALIEVDAANGTILSSTMTFTYRANGIAISPDGAFLYVPLEGGVPNTIAEITVATRAIRNIGVGGGPVGIALSPLQAELSTTNAASFSAGPLAVEAIGAIFGSNLASGVQAAGALPLPTSLAGTVVKIRDSLGVERLAPLFFVSSGQVNYQAPVGTTAGNATMTVSSLSGFVSIGDIRIVSVAPGLFSANANGQGVAAAVALRVRGDGSQSFEPVAQFDAAQNRFVPAPIDLGPDLENASDQVFLILYGTGLRFRSDLSAVTATIGGASSEVLFAGATPGFVGLDQVNLRLPRSLAGRGAVDIELRVNGQLANTVQVSVR
jgi:uncharacterized protein (TIGR03437 family)